MPTYTNSTSNVIFSGDPYIRFAPNTTTITDKYVKALPSGVTLTDHEPYSNPWILLATVSSYPSASINVAPYDSLIINNETNGTVTVEANGVTANALRLLPNTQSFFDNSKRHTGALKILATTGTNGAVYIYAQD